MYFWIPFQMLFRWLVIIFWAWFQTITVLRASTRKMQLTRWTLCPDTGTTIGTAIRRDVHLIAASTTPSGMTRDMAPSLAFATPSRVINLVEQETFLNTFMHSVTVGIQIEWSKHFSVILIIIRIIFPTIITKCLNMLHHYWSCPRWQGGELSR